MSNSQIPFSFNSQYISDLHILIIVYTQYMNSQQYRPPPQPQLLVKPPQPHNMVMPRHHFRSGSNSELIIATEQQCFEYHHPATVYISSPLLRSRSIRVPYRQSERVYEEPFARMPYQPVRQVGQGLGKHPCYGLQSHFMGVSCISRPNNRPKLPPRPQQQPQQQSRNTNTTSHTHIPPPSPPPVIPPLLSPSLLDSDSQPSSLQPQSQSILSHTLPLPLERINNCYYAFSEDSYQRHIDRIYQSLQPPWSWTATHPHPHQLRVHISSHIDQQFFKWYAYGVMVNLIGMERLEMFHQEFVLERGLPDLVKGVGDNSSIGRVLKVAELVKGVWIGGVYVRMLTYGRYTEVVKGMVANRGVGKMKLEVVFGYKGLFFLFAKEKPLPITKSTTEKPRYLIMWIPENDTQVITFEKAIGQGKKILKQLQQRYPNLTNTYRATKHNLQCLILSQTKGVGGINKRANDISILMGNKQSFTGSVCCIFKQRPATSLNPTNPTANPLSTFPQSTHTLTTHKLLSEYLLKHNLSIFQVLPHRLACPPKLRCIITTSALLESIKFLYFNELYNRSLFEIIREVTNMKVGVVKEQVYLYVSVQMMMINEGQEGRVAEEVVRSARLFPDEFFEGVFYEFGGVLDATLLRIKKDAGYLMDRELRTGCMDYRVVVREPMGLREIVWSILHKYQKQPLTLSPTNQPIKLPTLSTPTYPVYLPNLPNLQLWCTQSQSLCSRIRSLNGSESHILFPFLLKLLCQLLLSLPYESTMRKVERMHNSLVLCPAEITITVMGLLGLASQNKRAVAEQYYLKVLAAMHRLYCDPRARDNYFQEFEVWVMVRLVNLKRVEGGREYEVEYLWEVLEGMVGESPTQRPYTNPNPIKKYPFPTTPNPKPSSTTNTAQLLEWLLEHLPIMSPTDILWKRSELSKNDLNSSMSSQSRSTASRKQRTLIQAFERNEATIDKQHYTGLLIFGNGRRHISIYSPLKNLKVLKVACGISHTLISTPTSIYGWGQNQSQQLGPQPGSHLRKILTLPHAATKLSCGNQHSLAVIGRKLYMWGQKQGGIISGNGYQFDDAVCGGLHTVGIINGQVWTWGRGEGGQLGQPLRELKTRQGAESTEYFLGRPVRVEGVRGRRVRKVACGDAHTLVLTEEGEVYVFGFSYQGQLGLGLTGDSQTFQVFQPQLLKFFQNKVVDIAAGSTFSIFITQSRQVYSCGLNDFLQIGLDRTLTVIQKTLTPKPQPQRRPLAPGQLEFSYPNRLEYFSDSFFIKSVSCGENHSIASVEYHGQSLFIGWGMNKSLQLGVEHCVRTTPRTIPQLQRVPVREVCCGSVSTMVLSGEVARRNEEEQEEGFIGFPQFRSL